MLTSAVTAVAVTSDGAPNRNAASTITTPPAITGSRVSRISPVANACPSSQTATSTAATTISMNAGFQNTSEALSAIPSTPLEAIASGRLRPPRLAGATGGAGVAGVAEACGDVSSGSVM